MLDFQRYQQAFTAHIRHPNANKKPSGVNNTGMAVYREIVFNNLLSAVSACFPVCQQMLGKRAWQKWVRQFFAHYQATSPIFREIPQQFLQFLNTCKHAPSTLTQLAHYEWVELAVTSLATPSQKLSKQINLMQEKPVFAPHMLLEYDFAVHKILKKIKPTQEEKTYLLVYRNSNYEVKFFELNSITFALLTLLEVESMTGERALTSFAEQVNHIDAQIILMFGAELLQQLADAGAILGSTAE